MSRAVAVIVLAAGSGTRMKSKTMKVMHPLCGRSMIGHVLTAALAVEPEHVVAVVGHGRDQVGPHVLELVPDCVLAVQETQEGTGHAVRVGLEGLQSRVRDLAGTVVVMTGDTPLLEGRTVADLVEDHEQAGRAVTVLTGEVPEPFGYGRVVRDSSGDVAAIVEEKDATDEQRAVREINSGIYAFDAAFLGSALARIRNDNAKQEYYLTDVVGIAREDAVRIGAFVTDDVTQTEGANDRAQLAGLAAELNRRILARWMRDGVTVVDPGSTWIDVGVSLEPDVTILPGVQLLGTTTVAEDAVVGPDCTLKDVEVGSRRQGRPHARGARGRRRGRRASDPSPTCDPARCWGRAARSAPSSRPRTPASGTARRCPTSPTWVTPRSARAPTSGRARSSPTTTVSPSTAPPWGATRGPGRTTRSSPR